MASINIYTQPVIFEITEDEKQEIINCMIKEYEMKRRNHYIIFGTIQIYNLWTCPNPLYSLYQLLMNHYIPFESSETNTLCKRIYDNHLDEIMLNNQFEFG